MSAQLEQPKDKLESLVAPARPKQWIPTDEESVKKSNQLSENFVEYWRGHDSLTQSLERREIAKEEIAHLSQRLFDSNRTSEELEAIGAIYKPVKGESPLRGSPVRLPQEYLEMAHMQSRFYRTLMTHPAMLSSYIQIEDAGLKAASPDRLNSNHDLLDRKTAYTFDDFGFEPTPPKLDDQIEERTSHNFATGGIFSWTNHDFPSLYLMSSSMPDNWGYVAMATAAQIGAVTFCPLDGDVHDPEMQRLRFQYAKELIISGHLTKYHPYHDHMLPNEKTVEEYLPEFGLRHLGLALKPSKNIVKNYKDIIKNEDVKCVEIYDPGCTNLLRYSAEALRDAFPDLTIYGGRVLGFPESADLIEVLAKLRISLRYGIAEGQICSTSETGGGLAPKNCQGVAYTITNGHILKGTSSHPIIASVEAGATTRLGELVALGVAGYSTTNLVAGTLEHLPVHFAWSQDGWFFKPYSGEASPVTKIKGYLIDRMGNPINPEGVSGLVPINNYYTSLPYRTFALLVGLTKGLRFMREDSVIGALSSGRNFSNMITCFSDKAAKTAAVHHGSGNGK